LAVKIRLFRMGRKKSPFYRIVVMDSKTRRDGRYLDKIGTYNPITEPATVEINKEKALEWLGKGAVPTETVFNLFRKEGIALETHLIRKNASEQVRNVEMQKWDLAKKGRQSKDEPVIEAAVEEPKKARPPKPEAPKPEEAETVEEIVEETVTETVAETVAEVQADVQDEEAPETEEKAE